MNADSGYKTPSIAKFLMFNIILVPDTRKDKPTKRKFAFGLRGNHVWFLYFYELEMEENLIIFEVPSYFMVRQDAVKAYKP